MDASDDGTSFGARLGAEIRTAVLSSLPQDAGAALVEADLRDLLTTYASWRGRFIFRRPRRVHESRELTRHPERGRHEVALRSIRDAIKAGADLTPRLSDHVHTAHLPESVSSGRPRHRREDRDLLLADWGLHHLHLGTRRRKGRYARSDHVLIAYFDSADAYLVDLVRHNDNWAAVRLLEIVVRNWCHLAESWRLRGAVGLSREISDEERLSLRNAGVNVLVEIDGGVYLPMPAGQTLAGTPMAAARHIMGVMHQLEQVDSWFVEEPQWLEHHVAREGSRLPENPEWLPCVHDERYGAVEAATGIFVPFGALLPDLD